MRIERIGEREVAQRGPEFRHGGGSFDSLPVDVERRGDRFVARGQTFGHADIESADGRVRVGGPFENGRARLDFAGGQFSFRFRGERARGGEQDEERRRPLKQLFHNLSFSVHRWKTE